MHYWWIWHQQLKYADCGLQVSGGGGGEESGANWFLGKLKHRKIELISFGTPPLKGGARPMSDIIKTKKNIFDLLRRQITWNWSQWIWFRDHWVVALKKHYLVKILTSAKNIFCLLSPTIAVTFFFTIFWSHRFLSNCWLCKKNPAYGRQRISRPMRLVALIPKILLIASWSLLYNLLIQKCNKKMPKNMLKIQDWLND